MKTGIKHKALAILTAVLMIFAMMPVAALADDSTGTIKIKEGETWQVVDSGVTVENHGTIVKNNGTVTNNSGTIGDNYGTVSENHGIITNNYGSVTENHYDGTVTYNKKTSTYTGRINTNNGEIYVNDGSVAINRGKVKGNFTSVTTNEENGVIETNSGTVFNNYGTIGTNDNYNYNTEAHHEEYVMHNYGTITVNKTIVYQNYGLIETNESGGIVKNISITIDEQGTMATGTVTENRGEVYIVNGTVVTNTGREYYRFLILNYSSHTSVSSNGLKSAFNTEWLGKEAGVPMTATITLTPESGYEIKDVPGLPDNVSAAPNTDGTWTLTATGTKETHINVPESTAKKYTVTVNSGTGGGDYAAGATVTIKANDPADGKRFKGWTTEDGVTFADATAAETTFVMPAKAVTVIATYEDIPPVTHSVTVEDGEGSGNYEEGATVTIKANDPVDGKRFKGWTTEDGVTFANATAAETTFVMPAKAVTVTATYEDSPPVTYSVTVEDGEGGGDYAAGASVTITADAAETGKRFKEWTGADGLTFTSGNATTSQATFTMPARAVTLKATYEDIPVPPEPQDPVSIQDAEVALSKTAFTYNGAVQKPEIKSIGDKTLTEGADYVATWSNASSKNAGTYSVTITGKGDYTGTAKATYTISKAANPLSVTARTATLKAKKLKKKTQKLAAAKVMTVSHSQGAVSYKLAGVKKAKFKKYFKVDARTGKVTVKKKLKKGTYKLTISVTAAGGGNYNAATKTVIATVKIR